MRDFPFWCADVRSSTECVTAFAESHTDEAAGFYCKTCFLLFVGMTLLGYCTLQVFG